jgi:hypothetical protein
VALDVFDFLGLILAPRFAIPLAFAIAVGASYYFVSGEIPDSAAVAFCIGIVGLIVGVICHIAGGSKSGAA